MSANEPMPFVIFASGAGTNARALIEHAKKNPKLLEAKALISDRRGIPALGLAESLGIESHVVSHKDESALITLLERLKPKWALLAGYKRIMGKAFLDYFADDKIGASRVMNVHPSLLPAYPGLGGYERAFNDGVKFAGVTVHFVDSGLDTGPTILQEKFAREEGDTLASFSARAQKIEHRLFCEALDLAAAGEIQVKDSDGIKQVCVGRRK
ncbi:MAG: phosphoribosylglycinamide formyltransferase [Bdellovibrionota bacterium]